MMLPDLTEPQQRMLLAIAAGESVNTSGNRATTVRALEKRRLIVCRWNRIEMTEKGYTLVDRIRGVQRKKELWNRRPRK